MEKKEPRKRLIVEVKVIDKSSKFDSYKIPLIHPGETQRTNLWVAIENWTNTKKRKKFLKLKNH